MSDSTPTSVYLYYDEHDILLYVGITSRGMRRQTEHNRTKAWWQYVARQEVEHYDTRPEAIAREAALIGSRTPPFNTQKNADHARMEASYLAFRALPELETDPIDLLRSLGQKVPLALVEQDGTTVVLTTPPKYAHIAAGLTASNEVRALIGTTRCGRLIDATMVGPLLRLTMNVRKGATILEPFLRVKMKPTKAGMEFHTRNVQLAA